MILTCKNKKKMSYIYRQHRQQIRDARVRILYVSNHIANCARFQPVKFSILPLYKMQTDCVSARKIKEKHFIGLFKPKLNKSI